MEKLLPFAWRQLLHVTQTVAILNKIQGGKILFLSVKRSYISLFVICAVPLPLTHYINSLARNTRSQDNDDTMDNISYFGPYIQNENIARS